MTKPTGGPAFPNDEGARWSDRSGMMLRDWFAGQALAGITACGTMMHDRQQAEANARIAYRMADAMIVERDRRTE